MERINHLKSKAVFWANSNPKKFFFIGFSVVILSAMGNIIYEILNPTSEGLVVPNIPTSNFIGEEEIYNIGKEQKERILKELEEYKIKRNEVGLNQQDSARIEFLFKKLNILTNGY
ncbi:Uncharacterised protein [Candidatus Ornithobacterium hominis]|uniref:Uncharacterized protein n=1 Tax=Candidatus Ornithobacterium hominis TaxID=2497989 RepID=A0A383U4Z7_9FLAO|nr:hypothetical protein [Candidatus Ornithobacterium hominis]SZD74211.1 Uncharacterised protein [Candidatus Ornithobacterium hominis]